MGTDTYYKSHKAACDRSSKKYYVANSGTIRNKSKDYTGRYRANVVSLVGATCALDFLGNCRGARLIAHQKDGSGHEQAVRTILWNDPRRAHEFVMLCYRHHKFVHEMMENLGYNWGEIHWMVKVKNGNTTF